MHMHQRYEVKCLAKDPICGMNVDEKSAKFKSIYKDKTYYFCSSSCKEDFDKNTKYLT